MSRARLLQSAAVIAVLTITGATAQERYPGPQERYQSGPPYPYYGYDPSVGPAPWSNYGSARDYGVEREFDRYAKQRWPQQAFERPQDIDRPLDRQAVMPGGPDWRAQGPVGPFQDPSYPPFSYDQRAHQGPYDGGPEAGRALNRFGRPGEYGQFGRYDGSQVAQRPVFENTPLEQDLRQSGAMAGQRIPVIAAGELVGNTVLDASGKEIGRVTYLVLGARTGVVHFFMVSQGGSELTAVPWRAVQINADDALSVQLTDRALSDLPKLAAADLTGLTGPQILGRIQQVTVVPASEGGGQEPQASGSGSATQAGTQTGGGEAQPGAQASGEQTAAQQNAQQQQQTQAHQQAQPQQPQAQQQASTPQASQDASGGTEEAILIGRGGALVAAPGLSTVGELLGTAVYAAEGRPVGEIDELVIDERRGRVLYALVSTGGFLGSDERSIPVPFSAMHWVPTQMGFGLHLHSRQLASAPQLAGREVPSSIRARDLDRLYALYGVASPLQGGMADASGQGGLSSEEIRDRIERAGFSEVLWLERNGNAYRGEAVRNGAAWNLVVDARSGVIRETWMTPSAVRNHLRMQGFEQIGTIMRDGRTYVTSASRNGEEIELEVDAQTGAVITDDQG